MTETATEGVGVRPELISLGSAARERVLEQVAAKGGHCEACGATEFAVGDALYLGYLFLNEDADAYMVALTCRNPDCPKPRTAIRLCGKEFFTDGRGACVASDVSAYGAGRQPERPG
ncbi:hypothetical protein K3U93_16975 [Mycobacterium malmoense]|uniref:Uncharacterized protein n=1 Tax=Mycobacterium malmoense TaxID=1780 RepID=A0ABX3SQF4_MYCMA|nr:hypothetical protein [Mycobacterium malmoense]OIN81299.1 hypothetical protein BMG05_08340 [Mycobacterium malmoense]ORA81459.1 hypothetical protein BST29_14395 [Mycobacterium malmoense]QZA16363.1 hypothetical protein K3U93_16975 [Mycobacterium malmoense]UNB93166.1 hypothetical protein H5T25_16960 [Mycobacterium malmoense]